MSLMDYGMDSAMMAGKTARFSISWLVETSAVFPRKMISDERGRTCQYASTSALLPWHTTRELAPHHKADQNQPCQQQGIGFGFRNHACNYNDLSLIIDIRDSQYNQVAQA